MASKTFYCIEKIAPSGKLSLFRSLSAALGAGSIMFATMLFLVFLEETNHEDDHSDSHQNENHQQDD